MKINKFNFVVAMLWIPTLTISLIERDLFFTAVGIILLAVNSWFAFDNEETTLKSKQKNNNLKGEKKIKI